MLANAFYLSVRGGRRKEWEEMGTQKERERKGRRDGGNRWREVLRILLHQFT
jgi:hypothetical protein